MRRSTGPQRKSAAARQSGVRGGVNIVGRSRYASAEPMSQGDIVARDPQGLIIPEPALPASPPAAGAENNRKPRVASRANRLKGRDFLRRPQMVKAWSGRDV
jgi:hypothetical protein